MNGLLLIILSYRVLSDALPIFLKTEKVIEEMKLTENNSYFPKKFCGVEDIDELHSDTLTVMKRPRCGFPNIGAYSFFPGSPKWHIKNLTYSFQNYPQDLTLTEVHDAVAKALNLWRIHSPLTFTWVPKGGNISLFFYNSDHQTPFNEPVIAYAHGPGKGRGGDIYMNRNVTWTLDNNQTSANTAINFYIAVSHEIGHTMGLGHSHVLESVMFSDYTPYKYRYSKPGDYGSLELHPDDIAGLQALYGLP